jgi:hypothetical protein
MLLAAMHYQCTLAIRFMQTHIMDTNDNSQKEASASLWLLF